MNVLFFIFCLIKTNHYFCRHIVNRIIKHNFQQDTIMLTSQDIDQRIQQARSLHREGFNCSQAVFAACADLYGIPQEQALRLSASFGGGIGGTRNVCGAVCAMCMLEGLRSGSSTAGDFSGKKANYANVQQLLEQFSRQHGGSFICAELLQNPDSPSCNDKVANATRLALQNLLK